MGDYKNFSSGESDDCGVAGYDRDESLDRNCVDIDEEALSDDDSVLLDTTFIEALQIANDALDK
ncbi:Hypothetical protein PHPALM_12033 [Phytophthora palmivora]|uniref:Uncharacterized protein n=1 Tax=Phytophthora palmivora TaxID=4796 RepID=A0A2P4Y0S8_9STRA|nr:Hypothetical protein PHPALM_12033 [Phytophthora palmivora]